MVLGVIVVAIRGYLRGAVGFLIASVGGILSAWVSGVLGKNLAPWIYDNYVRQSMEEQISEIINETFSMGINDIGDSIFTNMPSFIWKFTDYNDMVYALDSVTGNSVEEIAYYATEIVSSVARPIYITLISAVFAMVLFLIFNMAILIVCKVSGVFNKIPLFGTANRIIGAILGLLYGCFLAWILACMVTVIAPTFDKNGTFRETVESGSFVFNTVNKNMEQISFGSLTEEQDEYGDEDYGYEDEDSYY